MPLQTGEAMAAFNQIFLSSTSCPNPRTEAYGSKIPGSLLYQARVYVQDRTSHVGRDSLE